MSDGPVHGSVHFNQPLFYEGMLTYLSLIFSWYCHFDDDMYVNTKQLHLLLKEFDPNNRYYFGRWSVNKQDRIPVRDNYENKIIDILIFHKSSE